MKNMRGQTDTIIMAVIMLVSGIVGLSIINAIMVDAANLESGSENDLNLSSGSDTLAVIGQGVTANSQVLINGTNAFEFTEGTEYSFNDDTGVITKLAGVSGDLLNDTLVNATYNKLRLSINV